MSEDIVMEPQSESITSGPNLADVAPHASPYAVPDRPEEMVAALREGVEYVDATKLIGALLAHTERLHKLTEVLALSLVTTQKSMIRAHQKLIELEADMAAAGIGGANGAGSKLIGIEPEKRVIQPGSASVRAYGKKAN